MGNFRFLLCLTGAFALSVSDGVAADEAYLISDGREVGDLETFKECDSCPEMVVLPAGRFSFGASAEEARAAFVGLWSKRLVDWGEDIVSRAIAVETPQHEVTIDVPIAMGRNEVTREEWAACVAGGGCADVADARLRFRLQRERDLIPQHPRGPISGITFHDMQGYVAWLNDRAGADAYRLPTEAEWEYAARAGTTTTYAQGDTLTRDQASFRLAWREWENGEKVWHYDPIEPGPPVRVDELDAANAWGLRHMSGNIGELTRSCRSARHLGFASSAKYLAASYRPLGCERVSKGGSYLADIELARPARRVSIPQDHWSDGIGFRVVREMHP